MKILREKLQVVWGAIQQFRQDFPLTNLFGFVGLFLLLIGLAGGVFLALSNQENRSHASGTITLQVDPNPQVDLAKRTVTFLVRLIPTGDTPPPVAAVKLHMEVRGRAFPFGGQGMLKFVSLSLHDPQVFPLEGDNPAGIPPFSTNPSASATPSLAPSVPPCQQGESGTPCSPTPTITVPPGCHLVRSVCDQIRLPGGAQPTTCPTPEVVCTTPTPSTFTPTPQVSTPTPCPLQPRGGANPIPCPRPSGYKVLGIQAAPPIPTGAGGILDKEQGQQSGHLYYSVGDLYAKAVTHPVTLADITYALTIPSGAGGIAQFQIDSLVKQMKDSSLTISFGPDTEVYGINPTGDIKQPFVKISFVAEPATFTWASIFHILATPTPVVPTPTPVPSLAPGSYPRYGTCGDHGQWVCTTNKSAGTVEYVDQTAGDQCSINATVAGVTRDKTIYCCSTGKAQHLTCGTSGQDVCTYSCPTKDIVYTGHSAATQCAINGTKAKLPRNTTVYCVCTGSNCPAPATPTPSQIKIPTPTPCLLSVSGVMKPCGVVTPSPASSVTLQMLLACIDLQKPMSDPTSNYNSASCTAYANRADADLNKDGYINGIDLNLFYRSGSQGQ